MSVAKPAKYKYEKELLKFIKLVYPDPRVRNPLEIQ